MQVGVVTSLPHENMALMDEIRSLLDAPPEGEADPYLERVEHTLTAGYVRALELEAERWRIERRIGLVVAALGDEGRLEPKAEELRRLARRMSEADGDLSRLRPLLESLRERARTLRAAR